MKRLLTSMSMILVSVIMSGCAIAQNQAVKNEQCDKATSDDGLMVCSIAMEQQLPDLITQEALKRCKCSYDKRFTFFEEDIEKLKEVAKENYIYALMSANAYDKGFQVTIPDWTRVQRLVSKHGLSADVYISNSKKEVVIAFRGTDDIKDWKYANLDTDTDGQYEDADKVFNKVAREHGGSKITTVGHSLGGGLAIHVSVRHQAVDSIVFDPSPRVFISKSGEKYTNNINIIYETGEILAAIRSIFTSLNNINHSEYRFNYLGGNAVSEHSMSNFAQCMYASTIEAKSNYFKECRDNTL